MTVETRLRDAMEAAVAPAIADPDSLVAAARRRGLGIRRRRQALGSLGVAAALAVVVVAPTFVAGDRGSEAGVAGTAVGTSPVSFDPSRTAPLTGRSTAAALLYAVGLVADGSASDIRGAADSREGAESYVIFRFAPSGSSTRGEVAVNVQPEFVLGSKPGDPTRDEVGRCQSFMSHCEERVLDDGSRLTTYDDLSSHTPGAIRRVASIYRPAQNFRVIASASNGFDVTELDEQITRTEPVLTTEQLVAIVTQPWWDARLPAYFTTQGAQLDDYSDRSSSAVASEAPTPSPNG